jgi:anthranilate phosphoribosyltransferase
MSRISEALDQLAIGRDLPEELVVGIMNDLLEGELTPVQVGGLLLGLRVKGESAEEIAAFAKALRAVSRQISAPDGAVDTCGTGGDGSGTFNISTTAAFVVAGAGVPVAKHGNRFASGKCGSADVLEQLGVPISQTPEESTQCLHEVGMAFLFAPLYHPAMGKVALFRRELGIRTIFNLLGPLLNPASAPYQLLGVSSPGLLPKMAEALKRLDSKRALVVVGDDGLDEVTLTGQTHAILVDQGVLKPFEIFPEDYGFKRCSLDALRGGSSEENARLTQGILQGETGPKRDIVLLNAGIAIYVAKRANTIQEGIDLARYSLDSGQAFGKLNSLRKTFQPVANSSLSS